MKLKTKLVLAITAMVFGLVASFSLLFISQIVHGRIAEAASDAHFIAAQVYDHSKDAVEADLNIAAEQRDTTPLPTIVQDSLTSDSGLNSLLNEITGYSQIAYDADVSDPSGKIILSTNTDLIGEQAETRPDVRELVDGGFWNQVRSIYGRPGVYEAGRDIDVRWPLDGDQRVKIGHARVGLSTVFLKSELKPQLDQALVFSLIAMLVSIALAAVLSNVALRPLEAIGKRLDRLTAGEIEIGPERQRRDEYGVVSTKIDRLGRQIRDVKEVFSALKENLDQLMANLEDGLMLFTRDAKIVLVSASAEQFVGRPRAEMLGSSVDQVFSGGTPLGRVVLDAFQRHESLEQHEVEERGRKIQVSVDLIEEEGEHIGALLTMRDAESMRRIEDEIELSRRLAAIGRLTSGVAHEVKNPINAIVVHLEILREKLKQLEPDTQRHVEIIGSEIHRLDRVVQTLVDFTRPVELKLTDVDLRRVVDDVLLLATADAEQRNVRIARDIATETLPVKVDSDLVKQALLNVVLNGVQAMPDGGTLGIAARRYDSTVEVDITDQGTGIPADIRDKIFNLYFTTKQKGSGIGLAMTYRVMQLHNGSIDFDSEQGRGTTFRLRLPASDARPAAAEELAARG